MSNEKIDSMPEAKLIKRKKFIVFIIGICIGLFLVFLVLLFMLISKDDSRDFVILVPGLILPIIILPLYVSLRRFNAELKKRQL